MLSGSTITSAKLRLYATTHASNYKYPAANPSNGSKDLYEAPKAWDENTVTWSSYGYTAGDGNNVPVPSVKITTNNNSSYNTWEEYDVTNSVKKHLATPSSNYGFMMVMQGTYNKRVGYYSSEHATAANRPQLVITYSGGPLVTKFALTTSATNGSITKSPDAATYDSASTVSLTAVPAAGYEFTGWSGAVSGSANPATVTMNAAKSVTATFTKMSGILMPSGTGNTVMITGDTTFYDDGGKNGTYSQLRTGVLTLTPSISETVVQVDFDSLNLEGEGITTFYDSLQIFDGASTSAPLIGTYSGKVNPGVIKSTTGSLTFRFVSDEGGDMSGWSANVSLASGPTAIHNRTVAEAAVMPLTISGTRLVIGGDRTAEVAFFDPSGRMIRQLVHEAGSGAIDLNGIGLPPGMVLIKSSLSKNAVRCLIDQ